MNIQSVGSFTPATQSPAREAKESVDNDRRPSPVKPTDTPKEKSIQPEELLDKIKDLTDNGAYHVRFETKESVNKLVVSLVDAESGELVRQIPPESLLEMAEYLKELSGNIVDSQG